jgi:peptidoglycan hydrolase-like protein with peptidoglycan-binding domain
MQRSKIGKQLLLSSVALMACVSLASAQSIKEGGSARSEHGISSQSSPGAAAPRGSEMRSQGRVESRGEGADRKASRANEQKPGKSHGQAANGERERATTGQGGGEKTQAARGSESKIERNEGITHDRKAAQDRKKNEKSTTGQASSTKNKSTAGRKATDRNEANKSQSHQEQSSEESAKSQSSARQSEQSQTKSSKSGELNRSTGTAVKQSPQTTGAAQSEQGGRQQTQTATQQSGTSLRSQAGATITSQQQSKIQQSVLSARNVPRVNDVNFDIRTNAVVPSHVHVVGVSSYPVLVEAFPRYRDDSFFVVEDEIVIVDHSHRIVDVVPAGPRAHFAHGGSSTSSVALDLSEPEIRELQQVLIDRGYYQGRVDGLIGPETREALISFQRKEGFEATGRIDNRTVSALGLSGRIGQNTQGAANQPANQTGTQSPSERSGDIGQGAPQRNESQNRPVNGATNSTEKQPTTSNQPRESKQPANQSSKNDQNTGSTSTTGQGSKPEAGSSLKTQDGRAHMRSPSEK